MKSILKQIAESNKAHEKAAADAMQKEVAKPDLEKGRRTFLKNTAWAGISLSSFMSLPIEDTIAQATSKVNRFSSPYNLKITDLRYTTVMHLGRPISIIKIDTNQGIYGLGEVRDGGDKRFALMLKSKLLGQNPANVEKVFKSLKQFGGHGRSGGGVSGVEMALWDLAGKTYNVPVWMLLGGKYRDKVRLYADTHGDTDIELIKRKVKHRVEEEGFTWLKMTRLYNLAKGRPGFYMNSTSPQLTKEGIQTIVEYVETIRNLVGNQIQITVDHFRDSNVNSMIYMGKALDPYRIAWIEEPVSWRTPDNLKAVTDAVDSPIACGEDIYLKETFAKLCDMHALDIVHPDLATAGGILETKKIGDYAEERGIGMALHYAGTPISFMANVHCAAATDNFSVLEYHPEGEEIDEWTSMVKPTGKQPLITKGYANVPEDSPGLGVELHESALKKILNPKDKSYFAPTPEWDEWRM